MKGEAWKREGLSKGGVLVSAGVNSYGDGPERYVGVLLDFSLKDQARALAAPALAEALEGLIPTNIDLNNRNVDDSFIVPCDVTVGELRAARAALTLARGGQ